MKHITSTDLQSREQVNLSFADYGRGIPVVLIHGWPLNKHMWEYQIDDLVSAGCRVIKYDRRGFGHSDKPWDGYDYDTLAADLHTLMETLDLHDAVLVGFSMGGGEVVRYLSKYGDARVSKIVLISTVLPFLIKAPDNPNGVDKSVFEKMKAEMKKDRMEFLTGFGKQFFGMTLVKKPLSQPLMEYYRMQCAMASPRATEKCVDSFSQTDFREDIKKINVPVLLIHGAEDSTVPIECSSNLTARMLHNPEYKVYENAPHGLFYTERERLNRDLVDFIKNQKTESIPEFELDNNRAAPQNI